LGCLCCTQTTIMTAISRMMGGISLLIRIE
jgi:hypothetical protein